MQPSVLTTTLGVCLAAVLAILGWFIREVLLVIKDIKKTLQQHIIDDTRIQTELNTNMTSQIKLGEKLEEKMDEIYDSLDKRDARIDEKLNKLNDKID